MDLLLDLSLRIVCIGASVSLLAYILRRAAPSLRHRLFTAALAAMLLLPLWTFYGPSLNAPILPAVDANPRYAALPEPATAPLASSAAPVRPRRLPSVPLPRTRPFPWAEFCFAVYAAGAALLLTRLIHGSLQVRGLIHTAQPGAGFAVSPRCASPVTAGWLRPKLLLPDSWKSWPYAKLAAVLAHEREHIRRRDPLIQWLALLNRAIFWFHPLAWWLERKLAALAEESCDSAVLASGVSPHDYAAWLIEIARTAAAGRTRLRTAGAIPFAHGDLGRRIRRLLDGPIPAISRRRAAAALALCTLMLAGFLVFRATRRPAQSYADLDRITRMRIVRTQYERQQSVVDAQKAAEALTPRSASALAARLRYQPGDPDILAVLHLYYQNRQDTKSLDGLALWYIANHPEVREGWGIRPEWDDVSNRADSARAVALWRTQLTKTWDTPFVYMNAADFLAGADDDLAEQAILEGRRRFPSPALHWEIFLARQYTQAVSGSNGAYAAKARQALLTSSDPEVLDRSLEQLQRNPNLELCSAIVDRELVLDPNNVSAHLRRHYCQLTAARLAQKDSAQPVSDSMRILLLSASFNGPGPRHPENAQPLLDLAARNPGDPNYGTAVFLANLSLGEWALDRGDVSAAVGHLLAAADAPPSEYTRYAQVDMTLTRRLVDAGRRGDVATFLERCAGFNRSHQPLRQWESEIRKGNNPNLVPNFNLARFRYRSVLETQRPLR